MYRSRGDLAKIEAAEILAERASPLDDALRGNLHLRAPVAIDERQPGRTTKASTACPRSVAFSIFSSSMV